MCSRKNNKELTNDVMLRDVGRKLSEVGQNLF